MAVLTLALGVGANTAMFSIIDGVLLKPPGYRQPDRLVSLHVRITTLRNLGTMPLPPFVYDLWREHAATLYGIAVVNPATENLTGLGEPERLLSARVSASLFPVLGVRPMLGRPFSRDEDVYQGPPVVILSYGFWRRHFASDASVLGRRIELNGSPYSVIGVMPPDFELPIDLETQHAAHFDVMLPADIGPDQRLSHGYWGVARLRPGATVEQARADLDATLASLPGGLERRAIIARLRNNLTARVARGLSLLMGAVGLVLLLACANLANLLLSRGLARRKELAVRAALGANRAQILRHLFSESLTLAICGGAAGVLTAACTLRAIVMRLPADLPHQAAISLDWRVMAFSSVVTCACALCFGALPACRFSSADPQEALSQRGSTDSRGTGALRQWLIAAQVAFSVMLLIGAGLLLRSFANILSAHRGFATENVITANVPLAGAGYQTPARRHAAYAAIGERLAALPGVSSVGAVTRLPLSGEGFVNPIFLPGVALTPERIRNLPMPRILFATPGYFRAAGIAIRYGRAYTDAAADLWGAVVSESAARRVWPAMSPIGREFTIDESPQPRIWRITGVVADVRQSGLDQPAPLIVYLPVNYSGASDFSFVLRSSLPAASLAGAIRRAVWQVDAHTPVTEIRTMREVVGDSTAQRRFQALVLSLFACAAVILSALGIYATLSYSVNRRTREIGVRLALGAQRQAIGSLMLRQALMPVAVGLGIGVTAALFLMRVLAGMLYGVGRADPATYTVSAVFIAAVAVVSCGVPVWRAMRLDPLETIRCE